MRASRRSLLRLAAGTGLLMLTGCTGPSVFPALPGAAPPAHKIRIAGLYGGPNTGGQNERLSMLLQQAVDTLVAAGSKNLDPRLDWIAVPPAVSGGPGKPYVPGEVQALDLAINGGSTGAPAASIPDVVAFSNSFALQQVVARKLLRPIDDLLRSTTVVQADDYFPGALDAGRIEGKLYGLPLSIMPGMLEYDSTLFKEAGLRAPDATWDWNRFLDACLKLTKPPTQYALLPFNPPSVLLFLWQNGADVLSKDGRQSTLDDPAAVEAATFYADLWRRHRVFPPTSTTNNGYSFNGTAIMYGGARIAMQFTAFPNLPGGLGGQRTWRMAEVFRGKEQATTTQLQSLIAMTSRTADPAETFGGSQRWPIRSRRTATCRRVAPWRRRPMPKSWVMPWTRTKPPPWCEQPNMPAPPRSTRMSTRPSTANCRPRCRSVIRARRRSARPQRRLSTISSLPAPTVRQARRRLPVLERHTRLHDGTLSHACAPDSARWKRCMGDEATQIGGDFHGARAHQERA